MTLVDTNLFVDLSSRGPWLHWSRDALTHAASFGALVTNHVVLAELHSGRAGQDGVRDLLLDLGVSVQPLTDDAARRAGRAHRLYLDRGGRAHAMVADFLIGAHAVVLGASLATRDRARFGSYFPELTIIAPESDQP